MKQIPLTQGKVALVDDEDFEFLNQFKWSAQKGRRDTWYAKRNKSRKENRGTLMMHRAIFGLTDSSIEVDHKDHDGLNNQRNNLRKCSQQQNAKNQTSHLNSASKYLGVFRRPEKKSRQWYAAIRTDGKLKSIGYFEKEEDAARAYDNAAKKYHGEFANLNFK